MDINSSIAYINDYLWHWPLLLFIFFAATTITVACQFVQFRHFFTAWRLTLKKEMNRSKGDMTPLEALFNALSISTGNGSIAGMATAVASGGPGAALWVFIFGFLGMGLRFAEVFLGSYFKPEHQADLTVGGPMIYLQRLPLGHFFSRMYALLLLFLGLAASAGMQSNSMCVGCVYLFGVPAWLVGLALFSFAFYVITGGAERIVSIVDAVVPFKVLAFFSTALVIIVYHYDKFVPALSLIIRSGFSSAAIAGGAAGFGVQQAMRYGFSRSINASEAGLGSAAVFFGGTNIAEPRKNGILSMLSVFMSANLVCFLVALIIVMTGVAHSGQTGLALTIAAYETVFGSFGGLIVTILSLVFGLGVMISYAYVSLSCWLFVTNGRFERLFKIIFPLSAFFGSISRVDLVWNLSDLVNAGLLIINILGLLWLLPLIAKEMRKSSY
ncbi:MAG TPA: amino acid carrier protein [Candidatus Babeliales bacterium]|nr:amino acid carrier protein [Candidatus Babeliales bacterium]